MKDTENDFKEFAESTVPESGSSFILQKIHEGIVLPSPLKVAGKFAVAHTLSTLVTLMSCAQFGVRIFFDGHGLMHYFMQISPTFCMAFCGALYLAITFLLARILLTRDEWLLLFRHKTLSTLAVGLISLGAFSLVSPEVTLPASLLWLVGAFLGAQAGSLRLRSLRAGFGL